MFARLSPYWLWLLLSLPALAMFPALTGDDARAFHRLLHPTGEFAARFHDHRHDGDTAGDAVSRLARATLAETNRRYFGVAAFGYAALHTAVYLIDADGWSEITGDLPKFYIWTGWLAFLIFIPLAATSNGLCCPQDGACVEILATLDLCGGGVDAAALGKPAQLGWVAACRSAVRAIGGAVGHTGFGGGILRPRHTAQRSA